MILSHFTKVQHSLDLTLDAILWLLLLLSHAQEASTNWEISNHCKKSRVTRSCYLKEYELGMFSQTNYCLFFFWFLLTSMRYSFCSGFLLYDSLSSNILLITNLLWIYSVKLASCCCIPLQIRVVQVHSVLPN